MASPSVASKRGWLGQATEARRLGIKVKLAQELDEGEAVVALDCDARVRPHVIAGAAASEAILLQHGSRLLAAVPSLGRGDEFKLRNGRLIIVSSMPRSPAGLIVTLKLTSATSDLYARADEELSDIERLNLIAHTLSVAFVRGAAEESLDPKAIALLRACGDDVPSDGREAYRYLDNVFQMQTERHNAERQAAFDETYGANTGGTVPYHRLSMTPTSVPVTKTRDEVITSAEWERARAARMGLMTARRQTKAIT